MNRCPHCQNDIPSGTRTCPACGRRLPLHNRFLDAFGSSIQSVFALAHGFVQRLIPGTVGDDIGCIIGFIAVMVYIITIILALVILFVAGRALVVGRIDKVDWIEEVFGVLEFLYHWG